jgi:glycosyltransferase involved in cell wall biosynthesis
VRGRLLANSAFVSNRIRRDHGIEAEVLYPPIDMAAVVGSAHVAREYITLVNPVAQKGLATAVALAAARPRERFLLVRSWTMNAVQRAALRDAETLPNIRCIGPLRDMRAVYACTRIGIVPSRVEEAFGRAALEFQANGVPVVASDIGGIPEVVGDGGRLVAPDAEPDAWLAALDAIDADWARYSEAARATAARECFRFDPLCARLLEASRC